ncbi:MAG: hypothetical protein H6741_09825 [Alphaproteobacteria bacterium]|nr:hypothetical protein [Alphaproteobacteria bacterium]MCB9793010.1 hypothetical protein [Alphaproteobacteria bacterium]
MNVDVILERTQWDFFWLPPGVEQVDRPELLYLRSARPSTMLNMVTRTRPRGPAHAGELVAEVAAAHAGPSRFQLVPQSGALLLRPFLETAGYRVSHVHDAMAIAVGDYQPRPASGVVVRQVLDLAGLRDSVEVSAQVFGDRPSYSEAELAQQLHECSAEGCRVQRFVAYDAVTDQPLAAANLNLFRDLRFGFFWAGGTLPEARGRGVYSALVAARVARAQALGLSHVGLYARLSSSAPIVEKQGFQRFGRMEHWDRA